LRRSRWPIRARVDGAQPPERQEDHFGRWVHPDYNTKSVEAAYMAVCHPDVETDLRTISAFKPVADYGPHTSPMEGEIGSVEQVRFLTSTVIAPFADAGGAKGVDALDERHRLPTSIRS
jgi:hypothetical protein